MVGKSGTVRISAIAAGNVAVVGEVDSGAVVAGEVGSGAAAAANTERQRRRKTKNERQRRKKKVLAQKPRLERENASERIRAGLHEPGLGFRHLNYGQVGQVPSHAWQHTLLNL
uniref:Uncharacterized protein n=1 Tax=Fagus sylvatica TaxID=28930 RepID=A0A2N9F804_FAGSY